MAGTTKRQQRTGLRKAKQEKALRRNPGNNQGGGSSAGRGSGQARRRQRQRQQRNQALS